MTHAQQQLTINFLRNASADVQGIAQFFSLILWLVIPPRNNDFRDGFTNNFRVFLHLRSHFANRALQHLRKRFGLNNNSTICLRQQASPTRIRLVQLLHVAGRIICQDVNLHARELSIVNGG